MEKFGLFNLISNLANANNQNSANLEQPKNLQPELKNKANTSTQSAKLFILRHEELSRKIDKSTKK